MRQSRQMSETFRLGLILAISGGFMDAYSYLFRGHVFANAQTGNMLLLGVNLSMQNYGNILRYFSPVVAFTIGIILSDIFRHKSNVEWKLHWRQISVLFEAIILFIVAFVPQNLNLLANSMTSLACGIQVESFRKIHGNGIATTMCIGNLRSGTQNLCNYFMKKEKNYLHTCILYYGIIFCFILGAVLGSVAIKYLQAKSILICSMMLFIVFLIMFVQNIYLEN
ncbi:YoaK family protein [Haloimpatiens sp. FM7315]|uniref:YoaK family protein n=1 Tax=Haloimpatiens sp. FM7315 TaxID=3298609 RepID=UPI00370AFF62